MLDSGETTLSKLTDVPRSLANTLVDAKAYGERAPVEQAMAWLRANAPIARIEADGHNPFWFVSKHKDVLEVGRSNDRFINSARPVILCDAEAEARNAEETAGFRTLVSMDAPDLQKYRSITQSWFMPKSLRAREDRIRAAARRSVDKLLEKGKDCDFATDLAVTYPLHIVMDILGVPQSDEDQMLIWAKAIIAAQDPEMRRKLAGDPDGQESHRQALGEMMQYFMQVAYDRRANPRDDVASIIANSRINDMPTSDIDVLGYYIIVATAGHDTTSASTGAAAHALARDPLLFERVKKDPDLIPALVDEAIRYMTPVQHFMRTAAIDTEIRGQSISKGDWILVSYLSGNRDEEVFANPYAFDIDRTPNPHLSFGFGAHLCLGQHLAKLEMRILLEELLQRVASMEMIGPERLVESTFVSGAKSLPMHIIPA